LCLGDVRTPPLQFGAKRAHHGLPDFHDLRSDEGGAAACLFAFDLLRLNGEDLRPLPLEERRGRLRRALRGANKALRFSEHLGGDGEAIFRHACALGS
jgi:bifunctional non-homologous end joining protein LigD